MKLLRVVEAQDAIFHVMGSGELADDEREVAAGTLDAARGIELGKESNQHAVSLTKTGGRNQGAQKKIIGVAPVKT